MANITHYERLRKAKVKSRGMVSLSAGTKVAPMRPNHLKQHRKKLKPKTTQADIAERMGVTVPQVSRWENGVDGIPSQRIDAILAAYQGTLEELFGSGEAAGLLAPTPSVRTITMAVNLPSEALLIGVMTALLDQIGVDPHEDDRAQTLAELFPDFFQFAVSWTEGPETFLAAIRSAIHPSDDDISPAQ